MNQPKPHAFFLDWTLAGACLLGAIGSTTIAGAQTPPDQPRHEGHEHMMPKPTQACASPGLECANAATPYLGNDGTLWLAWTAGGAVSVARSEDLGKSFGTRIEIANHQKSLDTGGDARPQIIGDDRGRMLIAYGFFKDSNWNAQIDISTSEDHGKTFSAPHSLIRGGASQRFPTLLLDASGNLFISWIDKRLVAESGKDGHKRLGGAIAYTWSRAWGQTFQPESIANEDSCECCRIGASLDARGEAVIMYRAIFPGGIRDHATQVIGTGGAPGKINRVSDDNWKTDICPHHGPAIAVSGSGTIHAAWFTQGSVRAGVFYARSTNQGADYSQPMRLGSVDSNVGRPYLITRENEVWMVWKEFDGKKASIFLRYSNDDGANWSKEKLIADTAGYSDHPLLIRQKKNIYLSWLTRSEGYRLIQLGGADNS